MRLTLIVEDDSLLAQTLKTALQNQGLRVVVARNLRIATNLTGLYKFDLVILDRVLPDGDGLDLAEELLNKNPQTRILMLTTKSAVEQRIEGLELGVDEYLAKPFSHQELILRVRNLLAKQKVSLSAAISCGGIVLFPKTCSLVIDGYWSKIRPRESQILACLIYHQNFVVTDEMLLDFVWGDKENLPSHRSISVYIRRIRVSLTHHAYHLRTVRGVGYCLS